MNVLFVMEMLALREKCQYSELIWSKCGNSQRLVRLFFCNPFYTNTFHHQLYIAYGYYISKHFSLTTLLTYFKDLKVVVDSITLHNFNRILKIFGFLCSISTTWRNYPAFFIFFTIERNIFVFPYRCWQNGERF